VTTSYACLLLMLPLPSPPKAVARLEVLFGHGTITDVDMELVEASTGRTCRKGEDISLDGEWHIHMLCTMNGHTFIAHSSLVSCLCFTLLAVPATVTMSGSKAQKKLMGTYTLQNEFHSGRPCYKHESRVTADGYLYYNDGVWMVGPELGNASKCSMAVLESAGECFHYAYHTRSLCTADLHSTYLLCILACFSRSLVRISLCSNSSRDFCDMECFQRRGLGF
jgi:hypothetical protein